MRFEKLRQGCLTKEMAIERIQITCKESNYEFIDFNGEWNGNTTELKIKCLKCNNIFPIRYTNFLNGKGCPKCNGGVTKDINEIIAKIQDKCEKLNCEFLYFCNNDGEKIEYKNCETHVRLKCKKCGNEWFSTTYNNFVNRIKTGCKICAQDNNVFRTSVNVVLDKINEICKQNDFTFIGFVDGMYKNNGSKLKIQCNKCGYVRTPTYSNFLKKHHCPKCLNMLPLSKEELIEKFHKIHGDKYEYYDVENTTHGTEILVKCKKHGFFKQSIGKHLIGQGCSKCNQSYIEKEIELKLNNLGIEFYYNKHYDFINGLQLDFYIPSKKIAIECQGIQHFEQVEHFGGIIALKKRIKLDEIKRKMCEINGIKLLYYSNLNITYPYDVYTNVEDIIEQINK